MDPIIENKLLQDQIIELSERVASMEAALAEAASRARRFRRRAVVTGLCASVLISGTAMAFTSGGAALAQFMSFSSPSAAVPALDTSVRWDRVDPPGTGVGYTHQVVSLITEATQTNSYAWPLYIQLTGTNSPNATQASSQSVGATVRAFNRSTGSPWLTGFHSEVFHGKDGLNGATIAAKGTSILYNGELTTYTGSGTTIGLNLQNTGSSTTPGSHAINIQPGQRGWMNGIHFDSGAVGNIGINFDAARYNMGIDLGDNSVRMNANQRMYLERFGSVYLQFNSSTNRVEIVRSGTVVASF